MSPLSKGPLSSEEHYNLTEILEIMAFVFPEIGYCQGMNNIAAALNNYLNENEATIGIFMGLIVSKRLRGLFKANTPEFHIKLFVLQKIIEESLPVL